jgi:DNA-binding MarR family transcriptional regulator
MVVKLQLLYRDAVTSEDRAPDAVIERALVRIRRDQQARHLQRSAAPASLADAARIRYLDALDGAGDGLPISQVADAIGVDRPRASRLTAELVDDGLVRRDRVPGDSRLSRVRLTPRGKSLVDGVHANRRRSVSHALEHFTDDEAATLAALLERFVDAWPRVAT